jgi:hypothetical protein
MAITEVTNESWFGRIGESIKGVLFGLLLLVVAAVVLFWNEGRAVREAQTIEEGRHNVVDAEAAKVDPADEGKLVHVSGLAATGETLADSTFGVSAAAVKLRRSVEMYQWQEHKKERTEKKLGGGTRTETTYTYDRTWSSQLIDSANFREHDKVNPTEMPFHSETFTAKDVALGAYRLTPSLLGQFDAWQPLAAGPASTPAPAAGPEATGPEATTTPRAASATPATQVMGLQARDGGYYLPRAAWAGGAAAATGTADASAAGPQIGDIRIRFDVVPPGPVSVISRQVKASFEPYQSKAGNTIDMLVAGTQSAELMFKQRADTNRMLTWLLRAGGFVAMLIGFSLILRPIAVLGDVVPFIGSLLGAGVFAISFGLSLCGSLVVIAIGWIVYRPLLGVALLVAAAVVFFGLRSLASGRRKQTAQREMQ